MLPAALKPYRKAFEHAYSGGAQPLLKLLARRPGDTPAPVRPAADDIPQRPLLDPAKLAVSLALGRYETGRA